ncbi:MAG: TlyA family rRNA (cytidine-2-O)-methyltransferase [Oscillospiraceae bacterium]|nr:TlyA family rRNA (cytidine-2-O)-methyltransferase [Oscillospiraceae bacterium]
MADKIRLDVAMVEQGLSPSREKAKAVIMTGNVLVDGEKQDKAGTLIKSHSVITIKGDHLKYVSRGGLKLEKTIHKYSLSLLNCVCMDIGASTGGFTDCMLQNGASKVYSIDVGYGQLAWSLRTDERVVNLERTNVRYITHEQVPELCDFASIDVSFISLTLVLPVLYEFLKETGRAVVLVKPQFEAGKGKVGKKGVVREPEIHLEVILKILDFCKQIGFFVIDMEYSPIKGPEGNIEYLFYIQKSDEQTLFDIKDAQDLVKRSHIELNGGV